ncbi:MAG: tRNA pseudouridine(38-40) synthase TruA [Alphaproteobacteria bacterium]|nr:tRNA pseudouridine(38-40) synthase TruA [Alphaproteobacteria bacterium]
MNFRIEIEFDGTAYAGWQRQGASLRSVQGVIEDAVFALCGERVEVVGAGRTDAGVHARDMTANFSVEKKLKLVEVVRGLNYHLGAAGNSVRILRARRVADDFNARFSCLGREYSYLILNREAESPLMANRVWKVHGRLDVAAMREAAAALLGRHDFTSFRASECQAASAIKTLDVLDVRRRAGNIIEIRAAAKSFLHHQVRNIVGTLKAVGEGKLAASDMARIIAACDRSAAGATAPACGLYFVRAKY